MHRHSRRLSEPASPGRSSRQQPVRRQLWIGLSPQEILARYPPGKTAPAKVLEILIELFNTQHTALEKTVSHKTRNERAQFLRRFFRDLKTRAHFKTVPDPRNLKQKHIHSMVRVWQQDRLAPATIQTYLSFLRGLATWVGKHGLVRAPDHYGLSLVEYERHEYAQFDKGWSAHGVDIDALIAKVIEYDRHVGASLRLIQALGLRRKESVQFRPFDSVVAFEDTGLPADQKREDRYVRIRGKGGRVRHIPLDSPARLAAVEFAQGIVSSRDAPLGDPARHLKQNLRRFDYVLEKFGVTARTLGVTGHGLRHEALIRFFGDVSGEVAPVRGGGSLPPEVDRAARRAVSELAGHARIRAAGAYLGGIAVRQCKGIDPATKQSE